MTSFSSQTIKQKEYAPRKHVNIWALKKDVNLKSLLLQIVDHLGQSNWYIDMSVKTSSTGIYLTHNDCRELRVYLHVNGQDPGYAGLHLEFPLAEDNSFSYMAYDNLKLPRLLDMLAAHFDIYPYNPL